MTTIQPGKPNLSALNIETLRKFKRYYKLTCDETREKLVPAVSRHFNSLMLDDQKVLTRLVSEVKRRKTTPTAPSNQPATATGAPSAVGAEVSTGGAAPATASAAPLATLAPVSTLAATPVAIAVAPAAPQDPAPVPPPTAAAAPSILDPL